MKYYITFSCLFLISCLFSHAQSLNDVANDSLVKYPEYLASQQRKENIYIHTDKDIYEPGENLWFKAYLLNGNDLELSAETQIIFVELIQLQEEENVQVVKEKYEANGGLASGHLFLEETLEEGTYKLIIHTKNTIESTSNELRSVKKIQIKESVIPKILIDAEFSKRVYNRDEAVEAEISVFSRSRAPYTNTTVVASVYAGAKRIGRMRVKTDDEGEAVIRFDKKSSQKATSIELLVKYKKLRARHSIEIPFSQISEIQFGMYPEGGNLVENLPNVVAFKALDPNGRPVQVEGTLYEDGKKMRSFTAAHYGMGKFGFIPKKDKKYTVQLTKPSIDSVFTLPEILPKGIKLQVDRRNKKFIQFSIARTKEIPVQDVYIRAQNRGLVYWMATASLSKERVAFRLPLEKFPQGIVEVTIFNQDFQPLAERLVYANLDQKLEVKLLNVSKSFYKQKEKVTLLFKVKDDTNTPAVANFSLSVHDHLYANKNNNYAIQPHYHLFSELKGHVYDANYYFDPKKENRAKNLDLLLLTQGWRNYVWNKENLLQTKPTVFEPLINGKLYKKLPNGALQNLPEASINVSYPDFTFNLVVDKSAAFTLPFSSYKQAQGSEMVLIPFEDQNAVIDLKDPFKMIKKATEKSNYLFPQNDLALQIKKQSSYDSKFSFSENNLLDEVNLSSFSDRKRNRGEKGEYDDGDGDYVCIYNILNCRNHPTGGKPIFGMTYRLNDGSFTVYTKEKKEKNKINERFAKVRGLYPEKVFYSPDYDANKDEALFPDNRKTLYWEPNLISNERGEIEVSFFTSDVQTTFLGKLEGTNGLGLLGGTLFQFDVD